MLKPKEKLTPGKVLLGWELHAFSRMEPEARRAFIADIVEQSVEAQTVVRIGQSADDKAAIAGALLMWNKLVARCLRS